jgi:hypothetical protein
MKRNPRIAICKNSFNFGVLCHNKDVVRVFPLLFLLCLPLPSAGAVAQDPFAGKWKLDETKAKAPPNGVRVESLRIEADPKRVTFFYQGTDDKGKPFEWKVAADIGGSDSGVLGSPEFDSVKCWRPDSHTILLKLSLQAQPVGWDTAELMKNGKSLRVTRTTTDGSGKEVKSMLWFEKQ